MTLIISLAIINHITIKNKEKKNHILDIGKRSEVFPVGADGIVESKDDKQHKTSNKRKTNKFQIKKSVSNNIIPIEPFVSIASR